MESKKIIIELIDWSKSLLIAVSMAIFISAFLFQPYMVSGSSMEPTLEGTDPMMKDRIGDRVMINKLAYTLGQEPKYNDMVIVDSRINRKRTLRDHFLESSIISLMIDHDEQKYWIKRVIGKPGDTIEYKDGKVIRNGIDIEESYIKEEMILPFKTVIVPENHVFVMGDNRNHSLDSREIGPIPVENIVGKVFFRFYPINKINKY